MFWIIVSYLLVGILLTVLADIYIKEAVATKLLRYPTSKEMWVLRVISTVGWLYFVIATAIDD